MHSDAGLQLYCLAVRAHMQMRPGCPEEEAEPGRGCSTRGGPSPKQGACAAAFVIPHFENGRHAVNTHTMRHCMDSVQESCHH